MVSYGDFAKNCGLLRIYELYHNLTNMPVMPHKSANLTIEITKLFYFSNPNMNSTKKPFVNA